MSDYKSSIKCPYCNHTDTLRFEIVLSTIIARHEEQEVYKKWFELECPKCDGKFEVARTSFYKTRGVKQHESDIFSS